MKCRRKSDKEISLRKVIKMPVEKGIKKCGNCGFRKVNEMPTEKGI